MFPTRLSDRRLTILLMSGLLCVGIASTPDRALAGTSAIAPAPPSQPGRLLGQALADFEEDNEFEQLGEGFHAIYVDRAGHVLGTFVNIPHAKIKVYASGQIEVVEHDYTVETEFNSDGQIRAIGSTNFSYFNNGRIREINDINFRYFSSGQLREIETTDFDYSSSGRLRKIENVRFNYDSLGLLETISATQTLNGIRIVVVD